jgi:hypothetical protein
MGCVNSKHSTASYLSQAKVSVIHPKIRRLCAKLGAALHPPTPELATSYFKNKCFLRELN